MNKTDKFIDQLEHKGVLNAALEIGIDTEIFRNETTAAMYCNHLWIVMNTPVVGTVINALPKINLCDKIPWEEWFRKDEILYHHLLFSSPKPESEMTWEGSLDDQDHPKLVLGRLWHVHNEEPTPYLIR